MPTLRNAFKLKMIKPKFKTVQDWEVAQSMMQPAFIRIVGNLQTFLQDSPWDGDFEDVQEPESGFLLVLTRKGHATQRVLLWELCFQVCFVEYPPQNSEGTVDIDMTFVQLTDEPDLDWAGLDTKVQQVLTTFLAQLPEQAVEA